MSKKGSILRHVNTLPNLIYGAVLLAAATLAAEVTLKGAAIEGRLTSEVIAAATLAFCLAWTRGGVTLLAPRRSRGVIALVLAAVLVFAFFLTGSLGAQAPWYSWVAFLLVLVASTLPDFFSRR